MEMRSSIIFVWDLVTVSFLGIWRIADEGHQPHSAPRHDDNRKQHLAKMSKGGGAWPLETPRNPQPLTQINTSGTRRTVWTKHHTFNHHRRSTPRKHGNTWNNSPPPPKNFDETAYQEIAEGGMTPYGGEQLRQAKRHRHTHINTHTHKHTHTDTCSQTHT